MPDVLNYGDEDSTSASDEPAAGPSQPPPISLTSSSAAASPADAAQPRMSGPGISETRRRVLESMRRRKAVTPSSISASVRPLQSTPSPQSTSDEAAKLEREVLGSTAEVPMEIDDVEDGEIADEPTPPPLPAPNPVPASIPVARSHSRGIKRPHAEDLMDNASRPTSAQRSAPPKRRVFGSLLYQQPNRLLVSLDDSDDSDSSDDDVDPPPPVHTPVIVIPPPIDKATMLAQKEERIRRLKEQIEAKLALHRANTSAAASGATTPTIESRVAQATLAAVDVGGNAAREDVDAAVEAVVEDQEAAKLQGWLRLRYLLLITDPRHTPGISGG